MWNAQQHSYEEIREIVVDALLNPHTTPHQWELLLTAVATEFAKRSGQHSPITPPLHPHDSELVRDVFWDLFRQGFITLGMNNSNPTWPWFRLSHFGQQRLKTLSPYRFHDTGSNMSEILHLNLHREFFAAIAKRQQARCIEANHLIGADGWKVEHIIRSYFAMAMRRMLRKCWCSFVVCVATAENVMPIMLSDLGGY
jgi:hypothetical protein